MKNYLEKHHRVYGGVGALIAFIITVIYLVVVPEESSSTKGVQKAVLVYGHSLCWFLLSGAGILWSIKGRNRWSGFLAYMALTAYVIFMSTLLVSNLYRI